MTPEELRARALAATDPVAPGARSYDWLRANVARRRRTRSVLVGAVVASSVVLVGIAYAVLPAGDDRTPPPTALRTPEQLSIPPISVPAGSSPGTSVYPYPYDVDGDQRSDVARLVRRGDRWGLRVERTRLGPTTLWMPVEAGLPRAALEGSSDIDGDSRTEIRIRVGQEGREKFYVLAVAAGDELVWLHDADGIKVLSHLDKGPVTKEFGCLRWGRHASRLLVVRHRTTSTLAEVRHGYTIENGRMRLVESEKGQYLGDVPNCLAYTSP